jgi:ribose-phosphate pyrophosphokinase
MKNVVFSLPGNEALTKHIAVLNNFELGKAEFGIFPDGESKQKLLTDVKDKTVFLVCNLYKPNEKLISLYLFATLTKSLGAKKICLISPYLAYLRQDKIFSQGEGLTSKYVADFISSFADEFITVDPHLHRISSLSEIFRIPTTALGTENYLAMWINKNVKNPIIIGPDSESEQWVKAVAEKAAAPYMILEKVRKGDRDVEVSFPDIKLLIERTPVLLDDIISTGRTMIETILKLKEQSAVSPVCIGIHAVFAEGAYEQLLEAGAAQVVSCNTIAHQSNKIDISDIYQIKNNTIN